MLAHDMTGRQRIEKKAIGDFWTIIDNNSLSIGAKEDYMNGFDWLYKLSFHVESEISTELDKDGFGRRVSTITAVDRGGG